MLLNIPQQTAQKTCATQHTTTNCTENLCYSTHHNKLHGKPVLLNTPQQTAQKTCITQHTTVNCAENLCYSTHHNKLCRQPVLLNTPQQTVQKTCVNASQQTAQKTCVTQRTPVKLHTKPVLLNTLQLNCTENLCYSTHSS